MRTPNAMLLIGILIVLGLVTAVAVNVKVVHSKARVQACIAKSTPAGNDTALAEQRAACERNPNAPTVLDFSTGGQR
jgi:hypothetical protein